MSETRVIKRYANRKLYDTQHSRYVTLDQIAEMIRHGDDVKIVDNKTKEDLTSITLAQIIFEEEKKQKSFLPLQAMRNIIQSGGESISQFVTQAQKKVTHFIKRDDAEDDEHAAPAVEGEGGGEPEAVEAHAEDDSDEGVQRRGLREMREWVENTQKAMDEWQRKVDGRIRHMFEGISPFAGMQKDMGALAARIAELEAKLASLKKTGDGDGSGGGNGA
jgi:polyhydroxyalkanoate synthesis repressor PhaR